MLGRHLRALAVLALAGCDDGASARRDAPRPDAVAPDAAPDAVALPDAAPDGPPPDAALDPDAVPTPEPDAAPAPDAAPDAFVDHAAPLTGAGEWAPMARITAAEVPQTPVEGRRAGCALYGESAGTRVRNVFQVLGGGLTQFLEPDATGQVRLVILVHAPDWAAGQSALALRETRVLLYDGFHDAAREFRVAPQSFVDEDPAQGPRVAIEGVRVEDGWIEAPPTDLLIPLPLLSATTVQLQLRLARLTGRVAADGPGFRVDRGSLAGYLTNEGLIDLVRQVQVVCRGDDPPGICVLLGGQLEQPLEDVVTLIRGIVGQPDVMVGARAARDCDPDEEACNAVAVCLALSARGVEVTGLLEP